MTTSNEQPRFLYWLINRSRTGGPVMGYERLDNAVVCATSESKAKNTHPLVGRVAENDNEFDGTWDGEKWSIVHETALWPSPSEIDVIYLGVADESVEIGVVSASISCHYH